MLVFAGPGVAVAVDRQQRFLLVFMAHGRGTLHTGWGWAYAVTRVQGLCSTKGIKKPKSKAKKKKTVFQPEHGRFYVARFLFPATLVHFETTVFIARITRRKITMIIIIIINSRVLLPTGRGKYSVSATHSTWYNNGVHNSFSLDPRPPDEQIKLEL